MHADPRITVLAQAPPLPHMQAIADGLERSEQAGEAKYPFDKIVWCNIGNPQILGQQPVTFFRQVCVCVGWG